MTIVRQPIQVFPLPEWAKWWGLIEFNLDLKVQLVALKYPTWEASYYPVYLDKDNRPLFSFPKTIDEMSKDERRWWCCPDRVSFSPKTRQIAIDHYVEEDYPRPYIAERQLASPPQYFAISTDSIRVNPKEFDNVLESLPKLSQDYEERKILLFEANQGNGKASVIWPENGS